MPQSFYSEKQSGAKRDREQLQAAIEYCRDGDTFVCVKADRIARSTKDFLDIIERLTAKGVGLKVLDQPELSGEGPTAEMLPDHSRRRLGSSNFRSFAIA